MLIHFIHTMTSNSEPNCFAHYKELFFMMNGDYISTLIELKPKYKNVSAQEMQLTQSCSSVLGIHQINALTPLNIWCLLFHCGLSNW